jgi:hypothetical protein
MKAAHNRVVQKPKDEAAENPGKPRNLNADEIKGLVEAPPEAGIASGTLSPKEQIDFERPAGRRTTSRRPTGRKR